VADVVDKPTRSRMMAGIRRRNTTPELAVRRALHQAGFRFRLDVQSLPGRPDVVLPRHRTVIFVHGCFWHRHPGCRFSTNPSTRRDFWERKFASNVARDEAAILELLEMGWRVATVWECATRTGDTKIYDMLFQWIRGESAVLDLGESDVIPARERLPSSLLS
jgi:DNA mismatch endonuclease (patch repair protein)